MFKKLTLSTVLAAILAVTTSAAFAAPTVQPSGAERFQDRGVAEDLGKH